MFLTFMSAALTDLPPPLLNFLPGGPVNDMLAREDVVYWICRFRTLDVSKLEERRRLIDSFVNSVTIFDDHILITFNYKEGSERVTFDDIKRSDLKSVGGPCGVSL